VDDVKVLARRYDIKVRQHGTSHVFFTFPSGNLPVPAKRPIKPVYIRQFVALIDTMLEDSK
jgi:hypothetical protein